MRGEPERGANDDVEEEEGACRRRDAVLGEARGTRFCCEGVIRETTAGEEEDDPLCVSSSLLRLLPLPLLELSVSLLRGDEFLRLDA